MIIILIYCWRLGSNSLKWDGENQSKHSGYQKQAAPGQSTHYYFRALEDLFGKENVFLFFFAWFAYFWLILHGNTFSRPAPGPRAAQNRSSVRVAVVMPHSFFNGKEYQKRMFSAANRYSRLEFTVSAKHYKQNIILLKCSSVNWCSSLLLRCCRPCQVQLRYKWNIKIKRKQNFAQNKKFKKKICIKSAKLFAVLVVAALFGFSMLNVRCWVRYVTSSSVRTWPLWSISPTARSMGGKPWDFITNVQIWWQPLIAKVRNPGFQM